MYFAWAHKNLGSGAKIEVFTQKKGDGEGERMSKNAISFPKPRVVLKDHKDSVNAPAWVVEPQALGRQNGYGLGGGGGGAGLDCENSAIIKSC